MVQFLVKRCIGLIFVILSVTFITFLAGYFAPGDPIEALLGQRFTGAAYHHLSHLYGLDLPFHLQYFHFLTNLVHFDFGYSYHFKGRLVVDMLKDGIPASTELGAWGLLLTILCGIPLGIFAAIKANTWMDTLSMSLALILFALPTFILAIFFQVAVVWLDKTTGLEWPVAQWGTPWVYDATTIPYKLGPILVFAAVSFAGIARLGRTSMLEVLRQDYVRTARAKGLLENAVIYRHALRNAMIPLVTVIGLSIGTLVTGFFFIEQIFNIPGIGSAALTAINGRDYPVIQATTVLGAVAVVVGNLLSDLLYTIVDPRIKAE